MSSHLDRARKYALQAESQNDTGTIHAYEGVQTYSLLSIAHSLAFIAQLMELQRTTPKAGEFVRR